MLHEEQMEEKRKKNQEDIQKRIAEVERQKAEEREADRERKRERGPAVLRKQGLKLLGRENIPGALSKAPPCNPGILYFLRHVRFTHNTRLSLKYLVHSYMMNSTIPTRGNPRT